MRLLFVLLSCAAVALATQTSYEGAKVFSVQLTNADQLKAFKGLEKYNIDSWDSPNANNKPFRVLVQPEMVSTFEAFLGDHNIFADIIIENAATVLAQEQARNARIAARRKFSGRSTESFDHYFRFEEITEFLQELAEERPDLISVQSAGKSSEGRDLWVARISATGFDGTKPIIFMDANIHAREWIAVMSTLYLIHEIVDHGNEYPELLAVDWVIVPMANPDGYEYSHIADRMWRKTMSVNADSTCLGTDANRNFNYQWELGTSTSDSPCSLLFRGPRAESEPEVVAIANLLRSYQNRIALYLAVHSYGDYLLYPFGYDFDIPNPNDAALNTLGNRVASAIRGVNSSRSYAVGNSASLLYPASGASDDFAAGSIRINYAYTVELSGGGSQGFDLPPASIGAVSSEIFAGYREYARFIAENF